MTLIDALTNKLGDDAVVSTPADMAKYLEEARHLYLGQALAVVRPRDTAEVAEVVALCRETKTAIVPMGGNTGLVAGAVAFGGIILSLERLNRIRALDEVNATVTVEAGVILANLQNAAAQADLLFPLSLASQGSCTIGGNLATNAGGSNVLRYGNTRELCLGLEVVLADGRILDGLRALRKDNSGYDLKQLFIGSEGTLGIITAAVMRLFPKPRASVVGFIGFASPHEAQNLFKRLQTANGDMLSAFELMPQFGLSCVLSHVSGTMNPLQADHAWYVLIELSSLEQRDDLPDILTGVLEGAFEANEIEDATIGASDTQNAALWRLREAMSEAQSLEGGVIKHDISVPLASIAAFIDEATRGVEAAMPGIRACPFGHMGDGNIHFNLSQPLDMPKTEFLKRWGELNDIVHGLADRYRGSIAAEHGIGLSKRDDLHRYKDPVALDLMYGVKRLLDPDNILNPGKVVSLSDDSPSALPI